jgi:hypothetical protein
MVPGCSSGRLLEERARVALAVCEATSSCDGSFLQEMLFAETNNHNMEKTGIQENVMRPEQCSVPLSLVLSVGSIQYYSWGDSGSDRMP